MDSAPTLAQRIAGRLRSWEGLLLVILVFVILVNALFASGYTGGQNQVNLWWISVEKAIVVLAMAFVIINGEIDLSVASVMGLASVVVAILWEQGIAIEIGILVAILVGVGVGLFNGFWVAIVGLPSLVVTLAGLIGFRGLAYMLIEDRSIGNQETAFPTWFEDLGQQPLSEMIGILGSIPILDRVPFALYVLGAAALALLKSLPGRRLIVTGLLASYGGLSLLYGKDARVIAPCMLFAALAAGIAVKCRRQS